MKPKSSPAMEDEDKVTEAATATVAVVAAAAAVVQQTKTTKNKASVRKQSQDEATWAYYAKSFTYLLGWSSVSGLIIILNNWIMHYDGFPFPITLSATGPLFSWMMAAVLVLTGHTKLERHMTFKTWLRNIFPIGFFTAITYATGNELYMFLSVSFIQMMKSLSPIVVLFLLVAFRLDVVTYPKLCGVLLMTIGMVIACYTEPMFNVKGQGGLASTPSTTPYTSHTAPPR